MGKRTAMISVVSGVAALAIFSIVILSASNQHSAVNRRHGKAHLHSVSAAAPTTSPASTSPPTSPPTTTGALPGTKSLDVLQLGATLTEKTPLTEDLSATLPRNAINFVTVSLYGHGTSDPEPSQGAYNWSSLDARMQQLAPLGSSVTIIMRVFDAPTWMKTNNDATLAVAPQHSQDFANLVLAAAKRYPQIHYYAIWNELSGYRAQGKQWDFKGYTDLYNVVYTTLKTYNQALLVGGPYAPFAPSGDRAFYSAIRGPWGVVDQRSLDAVSYWLQHKVGGDFLAIDGRTAYPGQTPTQPVGATELFSAIDNWAKQQTNLPIFWMEWYARSPQIGLAKWNAVTAYALMQLSSTGASAALLWDAENQAGAAITTPGLWISGTTQPTPLASVFQTLKNNLYKTQIALYSPTPGVEVLSNSSHFIAVEIDGVSHTSTILSQAVTIAPYQVLTK